MTAIEFIDTLKIIGQEYSGNIPKKVLFSLAKEFQYMPVPEVVKLLEDKNYDQRLGAVSILDWKARNKKTSSEERQAIYTAYIDNHQWIDDWGMVDRTAPYVVGGYLFGKDKKALYDLARSKNPTERRTAIVSTYYFIREDEIEDTFKIAEILANDSEHFVQTAMGSWIRDAGKRDEERLKSLFESVCSSYAESYLNPHCS